MNQQLVAPNLPTHTMPSHINHNASGSHLLPNGAGYTTDRAPSAQLLNNHSLSPYVTPPPRQIGQENSQLLHANYGTVAPQTGRSPSPNFPATSPSVQWSPSRPAPSPSHDSQSDDMEGVMVDDLLTA